MINLIPPHSKKRVVKEYWLRVFSLWLILSSLLIVTYIIASSPTIILLSSLNSANASNKATLSDEEVAFKELTKEVAETEKILNQLNKNKLTDIRLTELLYEIDALAPSGVSVDQFVFKTGVSDLEPIVIIGKANTRNQLTSFKDSLENSQHFGSVELPISNLAKDRDINFSLSVKYEKGKD